MSALRQKRPPASLIRSIVERVLSSAHADQKILDQATRALLTGTVYRFPKIHELVKEYRALLKTYKPRTDIERLLRRRAVRTDSGVAPITLLTKPYPCPGKCVYCPTEARMPKSYLANEPAAARALSLKFDPYVQIVRRVEALETNGHEAKKLELIIKGGTWSAYSWNYRRWFIKRCYDAANHLGRESHRRFASLAASQRANETARYRVIGLTIETRPDWVTAQEIVRLRELGVTRVELGVQATDDAILKLTQRGHSVEDVARATCLLKAAAFKVDYHFMPGQPGSSVEKDVAMFQELFTDARFCPDMLKLYPCVVLPTTELAAWHRAGKFNPLEGEALIEALIKMKTSVPRYCRLSRLIRDFPAPSIAAGNAVTNLRDVIKERMAARGLSCICLRCREAGHRVSRVVPTELQLWTEIYANAGGQEYFLSLEDPQRTTVYSFLRLRLPDEKFVPSSDKTSHQLADLRAAFPELRNAAFIRELHTYGQALDLGDASGQAVQHRGLGRRLMREAERIAREHGFASVAVISGIGVRDYYRKLGYRLAGTYMKKKLESTQKASRLVGE